MEKSGFLGKSGPDRNISKFNLGDQVRSDSDYFIFENPDQYPDRTEVFKAKLVRSGFFIGKSVPKSGPGRSFLSEIGPVRIFYFEKKIRTTDRTTKKSGPVRIIRTKNPDTDRTNEIRTEISGPRTGPKKSGPKYPYHGPDQKNPDQIKSGPRTGPDHSGPAVRATMVYFVLSERFV